MNEKGSLTQGCPEFPSGLWVSMHSFRDPEMSRVGVVTTGLKNFVGREVEMEGSAVQLESVLATANGLVAYLLQDGITVRDGDAFDVSATERIPGRLLGSRSFQGPPVFAAGLPSKCYTVSHDRR
jgi:hypothetical protein